MTKKSPNELGHHDLRLQRRLEEITKLIDSLGSKTVDGVSIIVEGARDLESLRRLGVTGRILCLKGRHNLGSFLDGVQNLEEAIILTDFDVEGEELARALEHELVHRRVRVDGTVRQRLRTLTAGGVSTIQGLYSFVETLRSKSPANLSHH